MFHHFNHRGDVVLITDGGGEIVKSLNYGAYGDVIGEEAKVMRTGLRSDSSMPEVFSGAYGIRRDNATGLDYMRFRWYANDLSSFISADRVRGTNRYNYAKGNPVKYVDPMGLNYQHYDLNEINNGVAPGVGVHPALDPNFPYYGSIPTSGIHPTPPGAIQIEPSKPIIFNGAVGVSLELAFSIFIAGKDFIKQQSTYQTFKFFGISKPYCKTDLAQLGGSVKIFYVNDFSVKNYEGKFVSLGFVYNPQILGINGAVFFSPGNLSTWGFSIGPYLGKPGADVSVGDTHFWYSGEEEPVRYPQYYDWITSSVIHWHDIMTGGWR